LRPLYYPKAIQEQQTQIQSITGGEAMQVVSGGVLFGARGWRRPRPGRAAPVARTYQLISWIKDPETRILQGL